MRCIIVDDSVRFLEVATARLGQAGLEVVGTATTSDEAIDKVELLRPDVVLVDISLGTRERLRPRESNSPSVPTHRWSC